MQEENSLHPPHPTPREEPAKSAHRSCKGDADMKEYTRLNPDRTLVLDTGTLNSPKGRAARRCAINLTYDEEDRMGVESALGMTLNSKDVCHENLPRLLRFQN